MVASLLFYCAVFFHLAKLPLDKAMSRGVFVRFFMQPHLCVCIMLGVGGELACRLAAAAAARLSAPTAASSRAVRTSLSVLGLAVIAVLAFANGVGRSMHATHGCSVETCVASPRQARRPRPR